MQKQTLHIAEISSTSAQTCRWITVVNIVLIILFTNNIFAQNLSIDWGKSWGSMQKESGNVLKKDSYGNMYLAGVFDKSFTYTISNIEYKVTSKGSNDIFFAKLNVNGELVNMQTIGGADNDVLQDMDVDAAGNVYLCGNFINAISLGSTDSAAYHSHGETDFFVSKYDTKGDCLFARTFGDFGDDICKNIRIDTDGNIFISGFFTEKIEFNKKADQLKSIYARGFNDVFLVKLNKDGDAKWARNYRPNTEVQSLSMDVDKLGSVFLAGVYQGNMYVNTGAKSVMLTSTLYSKDFYFSKYDSLGNHVFSRSVGNIGGEYVYQLCINQNSDIVIAGYFQQELDFDPSVNSFMLKSQNVQDGFVAGYSNTGAFKYVQRFPTTGNNAKFAMITDEQSNIYLSGIVYGLANFSGIGIKDTVVKSQGNADIFIAKYGSKGRLKSLHTMGGVDNEVPCAICKGLQGKLFVTGTFEDTCTFKMGTTAVKLSSKGKEDIFLFRLSESDANTNAPPFSLSGIVHTGSNYLAEGNVTLLQMQDTGYATIQQVPVIQGAFVFTNLTTGMYKLFVTAEGIDKYNYYPSYYVNKRTLDSSHEITVEGNTYGLDVWMQGKTKSEARQENRQTRLYPNPLIGEELSIDFHSLTNGIGVFSIHDLDGKILYQKELQVSEGRQQWKFAPTLSNQKLYVAKLIWQNGATEFMLSKQ